MEQMLLNLDIEAADDEEMNAIFRCAHSVKGGDGGGIFHRRYECDRD